MHSWFDFDTVQVPHRILGVTGSTRPLPRVFDAMEHCRNLE